MILSEIPIWIATPKGEVKTQSNCMITPELEILLPTELFAETQDFSVNVTYETYHTIDNTYVRVRNPIKNAIEKIIDKSYIRDVHLVGTGLISVTHGLIFVETSLYRFNGNELVELKQGLDLY